MRELAQDDLRLTHVASGEDWKALCGREVGPTEHVVNADDMQVVRLLTHMDKGCQRCSTVLMGTKSIKASQTDYQERRVFG